MRISDSFPLFVCGSFVAHNERGLVGAHENKRGEGRGGESRKAAKRASDDSVLEGTRRGICMYCTRIDFRST